MQRSTAHSQLIRDLSIVAKARALAAEQVELTHPHATSASIYGETLGMLIDEQIDLEV